MGSIIIADSSALVPLVIDTDTNHEKAIEISRFIQKKNFQLVIPADVFTETMNVIGKKSGHTAAVKTAEMILGLEVFVIVETDGKMRNLALKIFGKQANSVSFTDCVVMATAESFTTKLIFGFDEVFRKNGFKLPE